MVQMSEEIIKLRARVADLEGAQDNTRQAAALEAENQTYKEIISELSVRINELQDQGVRVNLKLLRWARPNRNCVKRTN
jgi:hypothetical protein